MLCFSWFGHGFIMSVPPYPNAGRYKARTLEWYATHRPLSVGDVCQSGYNVQTVYRISLKYESICNGKISNLIMGKVTDQRLRPNHNICVKSYLFIFLLLPSSSMNGSVRPSDPPFSPCSHHHEIFRSYHHLQKWCSCKSSMVIGYRSRSQRSKSYLTVYGL